MQKLQMEFWTPVWPSSIRVSVEDAVCVPLIVMDFALTYHNEDRPHKHKMTSVFSILLSRDLFKLLAACTYLLSGFFQTKSGFILRLAHPWMSPKPEIPQEDH